MGIRPQTQREQGLTAVVVFSLLLAVFFYMRVYQPKAEELNKTEARVAALDSANDRARAELAKGSVDQLRAKAARYAASLDLLRQLVPASHELPALLEQVSTAARRVNLDIGSVTPEPVLGGETFDTYRYHIALSGGYHALAEFLTNVGSLTRIVSPVQLKLSPAPVAVANPQQKGPAPKLDEAQIKSEFEIQTYVARGGSAAISEERAGGDVSREAQP
jgi:type IV pilus assembly protein PilO